MISDRSDVLIAEMRGSQEIAESTGHFPYKSAQWWAGELTEIKAALEARNAGVEAMQMKAIEIVNHARNSICLGGLAENRQHEESVVGPYLDCVEDELRELFWPNGSAA